MKKLICVVLSMLTLLCCLTACNFTQNMSGALAGEAEATPKAEKMMAALAKNSTDEAKALLHAKASGFLDTGITQMSDYLDGREVSSMSLISINVNTTKGAAGNSRQERVGYTATLSDGTIIYINAVYLSDQTDAGFLSFQIVLGIV